MSKVDDYREILSKLDDWDEYLRAELGLPGPRGNLELAHAAADLGDRARFEHFLSFDPGRAPVNNPNEFLAFCGVEGLGRLIAEGQTDLWPTLRACASDPRWRIREGTAMALQRVGQADMETLLGKMETWANGNWLEMRAAAAGLAEPAYYGKRNIFFGRLKSSTTSQARSHQHRSATIPFHLRKNMMKRDEDFKTLRKGLGYCWSVVVVALPTQGKASHGKLALQRRQRCALDHEGKPEEKAADKNGSGLGCRLLSTD